jgi:hypothetical protein
MTLTPPLVRQYKYIAVVLDDVLRPSMVILPWTCPNSWYGWNTIICHPSHQRSMVLRGPRLRRVNPVFGVSKSLKHTFKYFHVICSCVGIPSCTIPIFKAGVWHACLHNQLCPTISNLAVDTTMIAYHLVTNLRVDTGFGSPIGIGRDESVRCQCTGRRLPATSRCAPNGTAPTNSQNQDGSNVIGPNRRNEKIEGQYTCRNNAICRLFPMAQTKPQSSP